MRRILMGKIGAAHGVRGLVKLQVFSQDPLALNGHADFFTGAEGEATIQVRVKSMVGKSWLAEIDGIADRNRAEALRGTELWLGRDRLPGTTQPGEYYIADLVGLQVGEMDGQPVGKIIAVENFGAGDLLEIQPVEGAAYYLPFTAEILRVVDLAAGTMTIEMPAGFHD